MKCSFYDIRLRGGAYELFAIILHPFDDIADFNLLLNHLIDVLNNPILYLLYVI